jgi:hypothetical protein
MVQHLAALNMPAPGPRASLRLAEPPCASRLVVPAHLVRPPRDLDPAGDTIYAAFAGLVSAASGDGLLVLTTYDFPAKAPVVPGVIMRGGIRGRMVTEVTEEPDVARFVCNPLCGQLVRLPDIDGTTKTMWHSDIGILTQSERPDQPPDKYAVSVLSYGKDRSFVMRRFLSQTGKWDKIVGLPSSPLPLPLARPMGIYIAHEAVAYAGRLWYVDSARGAFSVDPFSDRPELRFVELPRGSVTEAQSTWTTRSEGICSATGAWVSAKGGCAMQRCHRKNRLCSARLHLTTTAAAGRWHYADSGRMKTCVRTSPRLLLLTH